MTSTAISPNLLAFSISNFKPQAKLASKWAYSHSLILRPIADWGVEMFSFPEALTGVNRVEFDAPNSRYVKVLERYIKEFLGVHFTDNSACGHRGISRLKWRRPKGLEKSPRLIPQVANFWFLSEGPKCREPHRGNLLYPRK